MTVIFYFQLRFWFIVYKFKLYQNNGRNF